MRGHNEMACVVRFLRQLGWEFSLDDEETVSVGIPAEQTIDDIGEALAMDCCDAVIHAIESEARRARRQFVGGPLNGERHPGKPGDMFVEFPCVDASGSVYVVSEDGRAFFQGYAESIEGARRGEVTGKPKE